MDGLAHSQIPHAPSQLEIPALIAGHEVDMNFALFYDALVEYDPL